MYFIKRKEKEILKDIDDGLIPYGGNLTVYEYVIQRRGVRENTRTGYNTVLRRLEKEPFGMRRIDEVKISDAKLWLIKLQENDGLSYSTIHSIRGVLRPAFKMALDDELIRKNPFDFSAFTIIVNDGVRRDALTHDQKENFWLLSKMTSIFVNIMMQYIFCFIRVCVFQNLPD